jgi:magnesium transporter
VCDASSVTDGAPGMSIHYVTSERVQDHAVADLPALLAREDGFVWADIPVCDEDAVVVLRDVFGFHEMAVHDCVVRNHVARIHAYSDHVFTVLHSPLIGKTGHVHYVELDQFLGARFLVTVHGPLNPVVEQREAEIDTSAVLARMRAGHMPVSSFALSALIVRSMARREIDMVADLAQRSGELERQVIDSGDDPEDAEDFLAELFRVWYELLAIRTIATHSSATYDRVARLARFLPADVRLTVEDLADGFDMVASMADWQR